MWCGGRQCWSCDMLEMDLWSIRPGSENSDYMLMSAEVVQPVRLGPMTPPVGPDGVELHLPNGLAKGHRGKLSDHRFHIGEHPIPTISEKPVKSLGRWCDASLKDKEQLRKDIASGLEKIDRTLPPAKLELWCMQYGLLPHLLWPLTLYKVPLSKVEKPI
ncbi:hypothetical protein OJAV_G00177210 [Oryzias javanicus]|uniref:Uncharacterized protein n=1 Tax=Oryzias javanicus TaxID=123683 RepID=A0A437CHP7_ORYJA|nr:hypothetical protein OJAV_G00177210 [Oryzias javanicus]